jgi:hypothetical protein
MTGDNATTTDTDADSDTDTDTVRRTPPTPCPHH